MVYFLRIGLNFFNSILSGVFFLFLVVMYLEVPGTPLVLCSVHSSITCILFPFFAITLCSNGPLLRQACKTKPVYNRRAS